MREEALDRPCHLEFLQRRRCRRVGSNTCHLEQQYHLFVELFASRPVDGGAVSLLLWRVTGDGILAGFLRHLRVLIFVF